MVALLLRGAFAGARVLGRRRRRRRGREDYSDDDYVLPSKPTPDYGRIIGNLSVDIGTELGLQIAAELGVSPALLAYLRARTGPPGRRFRAALGLAARNRRRAIAASCADARKAARRVHRQNLRDEIRATTRRRTGNLLRARVRGTGRGCNIRIVENFPATAFSTPRGRRGQYAYVLNSSRHFIPQARARTLTEMSHRLRVTFVKAGGLR